MKLSGLLVFKQRVNSDTRGSFFSFFPEDLLKLEPWTKGVHQINVAQNNFCGTVRGMHFQNTPHQEAKLVSCIRGSVIDVVIDLRENSPTFMQWEAIELSEDNKLSLFIPIGFAHGYQTLVDNTLLLYCHSNAYAPESEAGLNPRDPKIGIIWPLPITQISEKDTNRPFI